MSDAVAVLAPVNASLDHYRTDRHSVVPSRPFPYYDTYVDAADEPFAVLDGDWCDTLHHVPQSLAQDVHEALFGSLSVAPVEAAAFLVSPLALPLPSAIESETKTMYY